MGLTGIPPAVFMREGNAMDPRSVRTRQQLLAAFERQLEAGVTMPTVSSLAREAGVSRSSFYKHFTGAEEVGVAAFRAILDDFNPSANSGTISGIEPETASAASFEELFAHLGQHRQLCSAVLIPDIQLPALTELQTTLIAHLTEAISQVTGKPDDLPPNQAATFLVGGMIALFLTWLQDIDQSANDLALVVANMVPDWLHDARTLDTPILVSLATVRRNVVS